MDSPIQDDDVLRCKQEVTAAAIGNELALMSAERGRYYALNPTASDIWQRLGSPVSFRDLRAGLASHYDGDAKLIGEQVRELLERWSKEGLIEVSRAPGA